MPIDEQWDQSGLVGKMAAGRYLIVAELSADARRTLYEAEDVEHGTRISLGVLHASTATGDDSVKLRTLRHPNLISVLDAGKLETGEPFMTTEMVRGTSLRTLMNAGLLEQRRALSIVRQVLQALAAAHEVGAIHGDVKPENIMIAADEAGIERARLVDLGVAMLSGAVRVGDPRYRAPDRATGAVDPRTDLYSVGAVLFELLTGHPPFHADDASALIRLHAYAPIQTLQQRAPELRFASELEDLIARALEKKQDQRFRSANEMVGALDAALKSTETAPALAIAASQPQAPADDSLGLLLKGWTPVVQAPEPPTIVIPTNVSRQVQPLPWWIQARKLSLRVLDLTRRLGTKLIESLRWVYRKLKLGEALRWLDIKLKLSESLRKLDRKHRLIVAAIGGALVLALMIMVVASLGGDDQATAKTEVNARDSDIARRARTILDAGDAKQAAELIERELVVHPDDGAAYLVLGHARITLGRPSDGLAAYDRAIGLAPKLASDLDLIANLKHVLKSRDPAAAIAALELLSSRVSPPAYDAIVTQASNNTVADIRHRAFAIAEREGVADQIDRVASWTLDLKQATTCDERRTIIAKLAGTGDRRALPALSQSRTHKCVDREAATAIQKINAATKSTKTH